MASERSERGAQAPPRVDPVGALGTVAGRFGAWARKTGEARVAYAVLAVAYLAAAILILVWGKGQTFINDEWNYLVVFRGWNLETLLHPQNGHLIAFPLVVYKAMYATVGTTSHLPYQVATVVLHLLVATLFFQLVRGRVDLAVAVALTVLVVFFGAGWDTIMGAYELPNLLGMAAGLGMLLALERRTRGGDLAACVLLALSLASFSVGIAFAIGALLAILLGGRADWRRLWVVLLPAAFYLAWFLWARRFGQTEVTLASASSLFSGMADQVAAACAGITGLFRVPGSIELPMALEMRQEWGYPLAIVLAALVALHVRRLPRSIHFWTLLGVLLAYLALVAGGLDPARTPNASRYVYMGGILTLLLLAELAGDIRWSTVVGLVAVVLFGLALMANAAILRAGGRLFQAEGETNRAELAAVEFARGRFDSNLLVEDESTTHSHGDMLFPAWAYFGMVEESGSPAYDADELEASSELAREAADQELIRLLAISPKQLSGPLPRRGAGPTLLEAEGGDAVQRGACLRLRAEPGETAVFRLRLPPSGFSYRPGPGGRVELGLARFADAFEALEAPPGPVEVEIPRDAGRFAWRAELTTGGSVLACPA